MDPVKNEIVTSMSIKMKAEIFYFGRGLLRGELHSKYLETPYEFFSLVRMMGKMEEIFDAKKFPGTFLKARTFSSAKRKAKEGAPVGSKAAGEADAQMPFEDVDGTKSTFEITVRFRQNATWQGQILWVEENLRQDFKCVLEMLKLIDEALTDGEKADTPVVWIE